MKKFFVLTAVCLVLLTGCNKNTASANLPAQSNNGGTRAVNIPNGTDSTPDNSNPAENKDSSPDSSVSAGVKTPASTANNKSADDNGAASDSPDSADVEIKEKMFIAQTNDIYLNAEDYLGKTVKYEGIFDSYTWEEENLTYYYVIRYGPGCCGNDGNVGFEVVWDGGYPEKNDWVEVVGILEAYEEDGWQYLRLNLSSLTVLPMRGAEYVSQ